MILQGATDASVRLDRFRRTPGLRRIVRETRLSAADLILPIFVSERAIDAGPVSSMPGVSRIPLADVKRLAPVIRSAGVGGVLIFGTPAAKDEIGGVASDVDGVVPRAVRAFKSADPDVVVITDVCLCQYLTHGHCAIADNGEFDRSRTLAALGEIAAAHGASGADIVAPSAMRDGQVRAIRRALDSRDLMDVSVMSYAVKHASAFYGPFREAADSAPAFGDRRSHQLDPANSREALREAMRDIRDGADALLIKPGMPTLDVLSAVGALPDRPPIGAYQVSGEFAMIKAAAERGWIDERSAVLESLVAMKRAGADFIVTYFALDAAAWIREEIR